MDIQPSDIIQLVALIVLLVLSAFFSSAETALTTVNKIRMRTLSEAGDKRADRVLRITENSGKMLSAILIGNNIVNLSASSLATALAIRFFGSFGAGIATGILTFLILIFGEITPKTMATLHADKQSLRIAWIIDALMKILTPFIFIINTISIGILFLLRVDPNAKNNQMTEEELRTIVDVSQETGVIEDEEHDMIHNLFDFGDAEAKEVMIPRIDMVALPATATFEEILDLFREEKVTRIPVYEDTADHIIGIINIKDLLLCEKPEDFTLSEYMREPFFTFEHKNTADLFIEMRKNSIAMAIVLDEYSTTAGLVTLEDLLEEIVGEIRDEYDTDEIDAITQLNEFEFLILGSTSLADVSDALNITFESENYDTIGGYCLEHLEHLPEKNETILTDAKVLIRIDKIDQNRIERVYVKLPEEKLEEA